jgi:outer membrane murein-binding lipoprotein Lpp
MKKIIAIATVLSVAVMIGGVTPAKATTVEELQATIAALQQQLNAALAQLAALQGTGGGTVATSCNFTRNLYPGMRGSDVKCLQQYLNSAGYTVAQSGPGSAGNETEYYGSLTKAAVGAWQDANNVPYGNWKGYFGPVSRAKYNELAAATGGGQTGEEIGGETTPSAAGLTVALASDTPEAATVADNANTYFTKFTLTAGSEGDVKISKIYVTRSGLSANGDVENIKIVDAETGAYVGSIGSLNVDNRAMITFIPNLVISAGTSRAFYIKAGIKDGTTAGKTVKLGIASADDIVSDASAVSGSFPITGNTMTVVSLTIGSLTIAEDGTTVDSKPDAGDTDVTVLKWKATAGSTEAVTIETVTVKRTGTADATDTKNIELYDVTDGKSLGTVDNWDSEDKATWANLNVVIGKGKTHRFKVLVDVVGGVESTAQTINVDMVDGTDALVVVKGNTYGFYITPSYGSWNGKASNNQTIQSGSLTITKSANTPATGNIAAGDDVKLGVFDFEAKGEEIKITALTVTTTLTGFADSDITNVALYDESDNIVAGPVDLSSGDAAFTDTFIVPVGIHEYTVKATIADSADTGNTIKVGIKTPGTSITATGMTSNDSITATPSSTVYANTMTVAGAALTVTTLASPASRSIPAPTSDFVFATFSFDAASSGEDINVTDITVTDSTSEASYINNAELWADLTDATSSRGDVYETKISDTEQPTGTGNSDTTAYTLNQTLTIPKGTFRKVALVADLDSSASDSHTFYITTSGVTATGANTGESASVTYNTSSKQTIGVGTASLTVTKDSSSPVSDIIIGGSTGVELGVFRLAASNVEDLDLDQITLSATNGTYVDTFYFYNGDTLLGSVPGANSVTWVASDGTLTIPANGHKEITVKADLYPVDGTTISNGDTVKVGLEESNNVKTTGLSSGAARNSSASAYANAMKIYKSRPYFAKNSASPSGDLFPSSNANIAIFDVTADAGEDISFESGDSNKLVIKVDAQVTDTNTGYITFTLKDQDGNVLGYDSVSFGSALSLSGSSVTFDNTNSWGATPANGSTNSFTIPAGQTKKLYVYADTTDFEDNGDSIQVYLDDDADANCTFGINGSGTYAEGTKIFKGDIYAGSFVNP